MNRNPRKKSIKNDLICFFKSLFYNTYEPYKLNKQRKKYESTYLNDPKPLISVFTATYNRGELLIERALPSVLAQTYDNFEYIIVADCCTDNTVELVSKYKDPRIKLVEIKDRGNRYPPSPENNWFAGPVIASNVALKNVKGKWLTRLDDDDTWTEDHLEVLLKFAQEGNYEFVSGQYEEVRLNKKKIVDGEFAQGPYYSKKAKTPKGANPKIGGIQTWLYRSYLSFMKYNIDCWRKKWNRVNDIDISYRMFKAGVRMGFIEKLLAYVYPRPGEDTIGLDAYLKLGEEGKSPHK